MPTNRRWQKSGVKNMEAKSDPKSQDANDSTIFRTKIEPVKETPESPSEPLKPAEPEVITSEYTEKPPSISEEPYLVKMLEIGQAKDHFEMPSLIAEINEFVLSEFERQKLEDTPKSYEEVVSHYLKKLDLPDGIDKYTQVERLVEFIRIDKRLLDIAREKEELEKKPIEDLKSWQLRERIENGTS